MHLETLKVFCDVVETKSFSAAASQNFVTQSAVSQQVRMLEDRWGRRLLERTRGNVQLTPAGDILYQASKEIVQRFQDMETQLQTTASVVGGAVRVATVHSIGLYELSAPLKRYLKAFPQVQLHLEYSRSSKIYDDALKGQIDLGIVAFPTKRPGITVIPFRQDRLVLVTPPGHPLARHRSVAIR
jgi:DNA-binding transcriptional LysR family regulator